MKDELSGIYKILLRDLDKLLRKFDQSSGVNPEELIFAGQIFSLIATLNTNPYIAEEAFSVLDTPQYPGFSGFSKSKKKQINFASEMFFTRLETYDKGIQGEYRPGTYTHSPGVFVLPLANYSFGFNTFVELAPYSIYLAEIIDGPVYADGSEFYPDYYFMHDISVHSHFMDSRRGYFVTQLTGAERNYGVRHDPVFAKVRNAVESQILLPQTLELFENYNERIRLVEDKRESLLIKALIFFATHEKFATFHRDGMNNFVADIDARVEFTKRVQDKKDLGQAFKTVPTSVEINLAYKWLGDLLDWSPVVQD